MPKCWKRSFYIPGSNTVPVSYELFPAIVSGCPRDPGNPSFQSASEHHLSVVSVLLRQHSTRSPLAVLRFPPGLGQ